MCFCWKKAVSIMKKYSSIILSILCFLLLMGCNKGVDTTYVESIMVDGVLYEKAYAMPAEIDASSIIGRVEYYTDTIPERDGETNISKDLIGVPYAKVEGGIALLYKNEWYLCRAEFDDEGNDEIPDIEVEGTITYNGKKYKKSELCDATLHWLELSEQEKMLSSYMPPEFMIFEETWGITLTAKTVTPTSATIKCTQSGGEPTGELHTGSWYILETWTQENGWKEMPYIIDGEIGWEDIAWIIPMDGTCEWEINWEWLYGTIPEGKYRIGKSIDDFRGTGDYDTAIYYTEFEIVK